MHLCVPPSFRVCFFFPYYYPSTSDDYSLSLHDALPICFDAYAAVRDAVKQFLSPVPSDGWSGSGNLPVFHWTGTPGDRKSTRLNSSHVSISYAVFCLKTNIDA